MYWLQSRGGTPYILGWGGAARPLIPWPCIRQKSLIFLPCLRQNSDFWYPVRIRTQFVFYIRRTYAQTVYRLRKDTLFKTKIDKVDTLIKTKNVKIDTLFKTKIPPKHTLAGCTSPLSPYKGVPPPPGLQFQKRKDVPEGAEEPITHFLPTDNINHADLSFWRHIGKVFCYYILALLFLLHLNGNAFCLGKGEGGGESGAEFKLRVGIGRGWKCMDLTFVLLTPLS